jgi:hypothetical protein
MNTNRTHNVLWAVLLALGLGCSSPPRRYQNPEMDFGAIRTVAVMPLTNLSRDNLAGDRVRDVFSTMLLATGAVYVVPQGEVARALGKVGVALPPTPSVEEVVRLGAAMKADAVFVGTVKEYGEVRSGTANANVVSMSMQLFETGTGKVVWSGESTRGGISFGDRLLGGGGHPLNDVTEQAVNDLLSQLFK